MEFSCWPITQQLDLQEVRHLSASSDYLHVEHPATMVHLPHFRAGRGTITKHNTKVRPRRGHECRGAEYRYSSILSLAPRPGRFTPGKETRYPLYKRLSGPQCRCGRVPKISPPPVFDPRTVHPVAKCCTD